MTYYYYKTNDGKAFARLKKPADPSLGYVPSTKEEYDGALAMAEAAAAAWKESHHI